MKKLPLRALLLVILFCFAFNGLWSQNRSMTVTSVTLTVDTVSTVQAMQQVQQLITSNEGISDFDIKMSKCNFTLEQSTADQTFDKIKKDLEQAGYSVEVVARRSHQTFTRVAVDNCETRNPRRKDDPDK